MLYLLLYRSRCASMGPAPGIQGLMGRGMDLLGAAATLHRCMAHTRPKAFPRVLRAHLVNHT